MFLVGAFSLKEKSPTITVASFFFFFFRQTTDLIAYVPLFSTDFTRFTVNQAVKGSSPCFGHKLFRPFAKADETEETITLPFFSALCNFFSNFFAFNFFCIQYRVFCDILQQTKVPKSPLYGLFYRIQTVFYRMLMISS